MSRKLEVLIELVVGAWLLGASLRFTVLCIPFVVIMVRCNWLVFMKGTRLDVSTPHRSRPKESGSNDRPR